VAQDFNTVKRVRECANPLNDIKHLSLKILKRSTDEWIGIKVPTIVSQVQFDRVQKRFASNKQHFRNPRRLQLLSSLIRGS
jgi:hypothetical protein